LAGRGEGKKNHIREKEASTGKKKSRIQIVKPHKSGCRWKKRECSQNIGPGGGCRFRTEIQKKEKKRFGIRKRKQKKATKKKESGYRQTSGGCGKKSNAQSTAQPFGCVFQGGGNGQFDISNPGRTCLGPRGVCLGQADGGLKRPPSVGAENNKFHPCNKGGVSNNVFKVEPPKVRTICYVVPREK